jgi:hypothetical protein
MEEKLKDLVEGEIFWSRKDVPSAVRTLKRGHRAYDKVWTPIDNRLLLDYLVEFHGEPVELLEVGEQYLFYRENKSGTMFLYATGRNFEERLAIEKIMYRGKC